VAVSDHHLSLAGFPTGSAPDVDSGQSWAGLGNSRRAHACDDYAFIAAMSGWTPMMFMTRVRL
jgi:hypothetical protein